MFDNSILEVVIGLLFVFFVGSLAVSGMNEAVRKALNTRSKVLWAALQRILSDPEEDGEPGEKGKPIRDKVTVGKVPKRERPVRGSAAESLDLPSRIYDHPIIAQLDAAKIGAQSRLSHIPADDFARAFIDILTPDDPENKIWDGLQDGINQLPESLRPQFQLLYEEAGESLLTFRKSVETWFDTAMIGVSAWYKNRTRWAMLLYGVIVAVGLNISAIHVTAELHENKVVRDAVVQLAATQVAQTALECDDRECVEGEIEKLVDTGLPVLWRDCDPGDGYTSCGFEDGWATVGTLTGWLITAAALSMGASFWFTLLQRVFRLRSGAVGSKS